MFQDPLTAVMAMLLLCFVGMMVMFVFVIRSLSTQSDEVREAFRKQHLVLADLERQFMDLKIAVESRLDIEEQDGEEGDDDDTADTPLNMLTRDDPLLSMLDAASRSQASFLAAELRSERSLEDAVSDWDTRDTDAPASSLSRKNRGREAASSLTLSLWDDTPPTSLAGVRREDEEALFADHEDSAVLERKFQEPRMAESDAFDDGPALAPDNADEPDDSDAALAWRQAEEDDAVPVFDRDRANGEESAARRNVMKLEETSGLWVEQRPAEPQADPDPLESDYDARTMGSVDDGDYGFKVYSLGKREAATVDSDLREPDAERSVRRLLEDVGQAMSAGEAFAGYTDPDERDESRPANSFGRLPEQAPPAGPLEEDHGQPDSESVMSLGASYIALRSRAQKLFEDVSDALFTPPDEPAPAVKRVRVGPPAGDDFDRDSLNMGAPGAEAPVADAEDDAPPSGGQEDAVDEALAAGGREEPAPESDASEEILLTEVAQAPEAAPGEDDESDAPLPDAPEETGDEPVEDALSAYTKRFLSDQVSVPAHEPAAPRRQPERRPHPRRRPLGKRGPSSHAGDE